MTSIDGIEVMSTAEANVGWVDATGMPKGTIATDDINKVARELAYWVDGLQQRTRRNRPSMFDRQAYIAPDAPYQLMQIARKAVANDDIVGGVADVTEGLIFQGVKWESSEADEADIFNQINIDLNLDGFLRSWHREMFTYSQAVMAHWWAHRTYTVRGENILETPVASPTADTSNIPDSDVVEPRETSAATKRKRVKRKRKFDIVAPVALTFLDPLKVVPLRPGFFGEDRLAWQATKYEMAAWEKMGRDLIDDPILSTITAGKYEPDPDERTILSGYDVDPSRLLLLNPRHVFRTTRTKATYQRFPDVRLKSVFPLLDLKAQLTEADRVTLIGAANYILLVRKGEKDNPAQPEELANLQENFKVVAKLPVVIGDHRLQIDIITPDQSFVLDAKKYDVLDQRILNRTLGALQSNDGSGSRSTTPLMVARVVGRLLESQRHMMKRKLEREIAREVMLRNPDKFKTEPRLAFTPRNVKLDIADQEVQAIMSLRSSGDLSRETTLEEFGYDQDVEAMRREEEATSGKDDIFQTQVPFSTPNGGGPGGGATGPNGQPEPSQVAGARGGRPKGGGKTPQSPQAQTKARTPRGNKSTRGK